MRYDDALFAGAERFAVVKDYGGTDLCQISFHKPPELRNFGLSYSCSRFINGSSDLNPLDFSTWGHLQILVYPTPVRDTEDLTNRIIDTCRILVYPTPVRDTEDLTNRIIDTCRVIRENPGIFEREYVAQCADV
ncbi:hypothetical protein QE152_g9497 [Popillia japonica]|uniref:Uncharacterized protein n=1 Tax=Popillia japonica TaxID=7064 RepID=A0AAW1LYI6_POPJA